jgi:hypothetical protein
MIAENRVQCTSEINPTADPAMSNQPSRTIPVIAGFLICAFLIGTIALCASYIIQANARFALDAQRANDIVIQVERLRQQSGAAQIAMLRFRETNDPIFEAQVREYLDAARQSAGTVCETTYSEEVKKRADEMAHLCDMLAHLIRVETEVGEHLRRTITDGNKQHAALLLLLDNVESLFKDGAEVKKIRQIRELLFQLALQRHDLALSDAKLADAARRNLTVLIEKTETLFDELSREAVTEETKKAVAETGAQFHDQMKWTLELAALYTEQRRVREEMESIAVDLEERGEYLLMIASVRQSRLAETMPMYSRQAFLTLTVCCIVAVILCVITGIVVVRLVNRESFGGSSEVGFSANESSGDMRIVADRLQEVVNLLRK